MKSTSWFTLEDCKMAFNLFCCVYGVGTLGMPGNFSRAGPAIAIVAMLFMAFANIYSSIVCSKIMLKAPRTVKTFGDLGEWCMGPLGRWIIVFFHTAVCVLIPCLYLVLGGTFLPGLFPDTFSPEVWIGFMAVSLMPICLIPTLKEGAGIALVGCLGTILADVLGIAILMRGMKGHPSVPKPDISFDQIAMTFGNLSLAYGAGIVIPALQRQHSEPERMPRVICVTLTIVSVFFITLASTGYSAIGCQIAGNLLFSIFPHPSTGLATLGFLPNKGWAILAFLFMQLHITVAFAVILHPALYVFERTLLGMHKRQAENDQHIQDIEAAADYVVTDTPVENTDKATPTAEDNKAAMGSKAPRASKTGSVVSMVDIMREIDDEDAELAEYKGHEFKYIPMRIVLIVLMTALSIALKDHFSDLADFVGASAISVSCMIMPILFYFKKLWTTLPLWEKSFGSLVVVVCAVLGVYVSIQTGKALFKSGTPKPGAPVFEFCHKEHQFDIYYNATLAHSG